MSGRMKIDFWVLQVWKELKNNNVLEVIINKRSDLHRALEYTPHRFEKQSQLSSLVQLLDSDIDALFICCRLRLRDGVLPASHIQLEPALRTAESSVGKCEDESDRKSVV